MMAKEYIEREVLRKKIFPYEGIDKAKYAINAKAVEAAINGTPAADVVEVKHGEWKKRGNEKKCSRCEFIYYSNNDEWSFCPNCGAKMDGERKEQG